MAVNPSFKLKFDFWYYQVGKQADKQAGKQAGNKADQTIILKKLTVFNVLLGLVGDIHGNYRQTRYDYYYEVDYYVDYNTGLVFAPDFKKCQVIQILEFSYIYFILFWKSMATQILQYSFILCQFCLIVADSATTKKITGILAEWGRILQM